MPTRCSNKGPTATFETAHSLRVFSEAIGRRLRLLFAPMSIEEAVFELHGAPVILTYRFTVDRVAVEQRLQLRGQGLETGIGVSLHPLGIKRSHFGTCQRLSERGIKPHA